MTATQQGDLDDILTAIREVEANLDRREARAGGAIHVIWGTVAALVFAFYHLVVLNPRPFVDALGASGVNWVWLLPMAVGYMLTLAVGARIGRIRRDGDASRAVRVTLVTVLVPTALVSASVLLDWHGLSIPGVWILYTGLLEVTCRENRPGLLARLHLGYGAAAVATGVLLQFWSPSWQYLLGALWFGVGYVALGTYRYVKGPAA